MGSFFTNVQVFCGGAEALELRSRIAKELTSTLLADGRFRALEPGEKSDRRIVLRARRGDRWISIYDTVIEGQDPGELAAFLSQVSASAEAVAVMMHDSDVLALWLARRGEVVDRFCNAPDYFGEPDPAMGGEGVPEAWAALLGSRAPSALQELWSRNKDDPEELLAEAVGIFGWDADRAESGHSHLGARPAGEDLVLEFCLTSPATWKRTSTRAPALHPDEVDLGELGVSGSALARRISQAATLQVPAELTVDAWNHGGAFTGVRLVGTWRPEELEISSVEMWTGGEGRPVPVRWSAHGEHPLVADVPLAVGAGPEDPMDVAESGYLEDMLEERGGAMVIARLHLVPKVRGRIEGTLSLAPPEGGRAAEYRFTLIVG